MTALRALLTEIVDYAGLFPPAGLDLTTTADNYAAYVASDDAWMLGRLVVPVARLDELARATETRRGHEGSPWRIAALLGADPLSDIERARAFNAGRRDSAGITVDVLEGKLPAPTLAEVATKTREDFEVFAELSLDEPIERLKANLSAVGAAGLRAKFRTGGVTPGAIPHARLLLRAMRCAIEMRIPFKATAGLHHPLCGDHPLTYEAAAPHAIMFGFVNVFLAAAFLQQGMSGDDALRLLAERDASAFSFADETVQWRGCTLSDSELASARQLVARSFGSCSFREPVDDLRALGWLPTT